MCIRDRDTNGNCTIEDEILPLDILSAAMAAKGCGGKVIVQAKHIVQADTIPSRQVAVPGIFVDAIVVPDNPEETHRPVSYTHLDVYKRQILFREQWEKKIELYKRRIRAIMKKEIK